METKPSLIQQFRERFWDGSKGKGLRMKHNETDSFLATAFNLESFLQESLTNLEKEVEGEMVPCLGNEDMMLGIEDRAKNTTLRKVLTIIRKLKGE